MKTTRRGWLTAVSSLVALPVLSKSSTRAAGADSPPQTLTDHFARLSYPDDAECRPDLEFWEGATRIPVTLDGLSIREEQVRDSLHYLRSQGAGYHQTLPLEAGLRDLATARLLLTQLPTGRPLRFHYQSGSTPGLDRAVLPTLVFELESTLPDRWPSLDGGFNLTLYLQAYCLERLAPRTFRLDRITRLTPLA